MAKIKIKEGVFRKDFKRMFEVTDVLTSEKLNHTPFVVLDGKVGIALCANAIDLAANYDEDVEVLIQWKGKFRSDFIQLTVGDVKKALSEK